MIRCAGKKPDGTPCNYTSEEKFQFCPTCGCGDSVEESVVTVIRCPGRTKFCGTTLLSDVKKKFCTECGWKIDRSLFESPLNICPGQTEDGTPCEEEVREGVKFCSNCGYKFLPEDDTNDRKNMSQEGVEGESNTRKDDVDKNVSSRDQQESVTEDCSVREKKNFEEASADNSEKTSVKPDTVLDVEFIDENENESSTPKNASQDSDTLVALLNTYTGYDQPKPSSPPDGSNVEISLKDQSSSPRKDVSEENENDESITGQAKTEVQTQNALSDLGHKGTNLDVPKDKDSTNQASVLGADQDNCNPQTLSQADKNIESPPSDNNNMTGKCESQASGEEETEDSQEDSEEDSQENSDDDEEEENNEETEDKDATNEDKEEVHTTADGSSVDKSSDGSPGPSGSQVSQSSTDPSNNTDNVQQNTNEMGKSNQRTKGHKSSKKKGKKKRKKKRNRNKQKTSEVQAEGRQLQTEKWENGDYVDVIFHVVVSEDFKIQPEKDSVFIAFGHDMLGGWSTKWKMKFMGKAGNLLKYSYCLPMLKDVRNRGFSYKYLVVTAYDKKPKWERVHFLQRGYNIISNPNRHFHYPEEKIQSDDPWNKYDGFVYPEPTPGFFQSLTRLFEGKIQHKLRKDVRKAAAIYLPSPTSVHAVLQKNNPEKSESAETLVWKVVDIISGLFPQMVDKDMFMLDLKLKREILTDYITSLVNELSKPTQSDGKQGNGQNCQRLVLGVFIMMLLKKNDVALTLQLERKHMNILLPQPDLEEKECPDMTSLEKHFPGKTKYLVDLVLDWIQNHCYTFTKGGHTVADSSWLYTVPLLHFLRKDSVPFKKILKPDHNKDEWWGHIGLILYKNKLKDFDLWSVPHEEVIKDLEYLFEVDYLLPRTIMACVSMKNLARVVSLHEVPAVICSATLSYYSRGNGCFYSGQEKMYLAKCIKEVKHKFDQERKQRSKSHDTRCSMEDCFCERNLGMRITSSVLDGCLKDSLQYVEVIHTATELFASSIYECPLHEVDLANTQTKEFQNKQRQSFRSVVEEFWRKINTWMDHRFLIGKCFGKCLQCWNLMLDVDFGIPNLTEEWKTVLLNAVEKVLSKMTPDDCFNLFLNDITFKLHKDLVERMTKAAFTSFEKLIDVDVKILNRPIDSKYGHLLTCLLESHWPAQYDEEGLIHHILTWKPLSLYFRHFSHDETFRNWLSVTCAEHLEKAKALLQGLVTSLLEGNILLKLLALILEFREHFLEILLASRCCDEGGIQTLHCVLEARHKEHEAFIRNLKYADTLLNMAVHIKNVDSTHLVEKIHEMERCLDYEILADVCKPLPTERVLTENLQEYKPKVPIKGFGEKTLDIVPQLQKWRDSLIFKEMWRKQCLLVPEGTDFEQAVTLVWQKTKKSWTTLCQKVRDGDETFSIVHKHMSILEKDFVKIEAEFKLMFGKASSDLVAERLEQLKIYDKLQGCQKAAQIIMDIKQIYGFEGNFEPVAQVQNLVNNNNLPMKNLDRSVVDTCEILEDLDDDEKQKCIKAFKDSKPLVEWLQTSMEDMKEVKVFVDLAYISAGEEDGEIGKVNCFHAAVTGYAPLIFNTPQKSDCRVFLDNCKLIWREIKTDKMLHKKMTDANYHLHWLKEVKASHGSVEVTSLTQADMINTRGCYRIGNLGKHQNVFDLTLNNVISLYVPPDSRSQKDQKEMQPENFSGRQYTHDQLVDLQSRLMLVAGKAEMGKENVDCFVMVLDGIVRLAKTYIQLCMDGCVLFNCWNGEFLCEKERSACAILGFGLDTHRETLKGHRGEENVDKFVLALANQFEKFHEEWLKYVSDKRDEYLELNFYTIDQLVFLQRELIKLGTEKEPSVQVYPMLSLIKSNCTQADLTHAMQNAEDEVLGRKRERKCDTDVTDILPDNHPQQTFIHAMLEAGNSECLAKHALAAVDDPEDITAGIVWCIQHHDDEFEEEMDTEPTFSGWQAGTESVSVSAAALVKAVSDEKRDNINVDKLISKLESLWTKFLDAVSSSVADYLSLEHLGIILRELAEADAQEFNRTIPPPLKPGIPNLIVCPQVDMLNAVMYIYKHSEDQPLPQPDEVLLCTPHTSFDQVDIFLRRSLCSRRGKVYSLVNADLLQYEIQEKTEKKLKYAREGVTYQLVILCSTENEFKARIVATLERNRCPPPPLQNLDEIKQYLRTKFCTECDEGGIKSASHLDFDGSTVRVVKSTRAGVGKSLYKKRRVEALQRLNPRISATSVSIHLYQKTVSTAAVAEKLLNHTLQQGQIIPRVFHLDISYEVQEGVDFLLFNLLVLGCISNNMGHIWLRSPLDLYLVETILITDARHERRVGQRLIHPLLEVLPDVHCWSPEDSLQILKTDNRPDGYKESDSLFDEIEFKSPVYQRPFQYLKRWSTNASLSTVQPANPEGTPQECLSVLLQHCGVRNPAWSELHNFVWFLNTQLEDFEKSDFCRDWVLEDLPGFPVFVLKFLIQMSRDFATRSLQMSEESPHQQLTLPEAENDLTHFQMKRTWESSPHPYIFFNPDGHTMTFLGFNIDLHTGNLVDESTGQVLERGLVSKRLQDALIRNRVNINENFNLLPRSARLEKLCHVMPGVDPMTMKDPDLTYELTTDNVKKILAIYMRFRCNIPVIIMGETGCGKTRLVKFMCALQCPPGSDIENMVIMKVHGGTTSDDISRKVRYAEKLAIQNNRKNEHMYTVLFFDEANTTESVGLIKEIMCDGTMEGQPLRLSRNLKIVAACNPYRKHSDELIQRLEKAGLGYHVDADKTTDKLGRVPMRRLVYRVQPLPQSMLPLVWDFGQLNTDVEKLYIKQMVNRYIRNGDLPNLQGLDETVSQILMESQNFMRQLKDECSFVSLRDVDRALSVMAWFYQQDQKHGTLFELIDNRLTEDEESEAEEESEEESEEEESDDEDETEMTVQLLPSSITKALILALSVCYRASLRSRDEFDSHIIQYFQGVCTVPGDKQQMVQVIDSCQSVFVDQVQLEDNIAKNLALKENLFMMVVCIELRIPLFLVGKPGSSKSLAKTIVADAMQGNSARTDLFRQLKQAQMVSFQCSPLATAEGIVGTFRQCARYQQDKDLDRFVSIVVLDEVGLAEDSPRMPLKTLHPLLEDGCQGDEDPEPYMKVAFIGISNWALDPAKMNRGILVQREAPDEGELVESARGICSSNKKVLLKIEALLPQLAAAYENIFSLSQQARREFFGLRDYYSLVKMVYAFAAAHDRDVCWHQLVHAIKRNFGGLDKPDPVSVFKEKLTVPKNETFHNGDPDSTTTALIEAGLFGDETSSESRYLLLLTENYGALGILQQQILENHRVITIFGSSFPKDQEYTQICRNINRIKVCMETGSTVILLNLENLYESLYDALNQYYARLGGERFVDLGLGTHRVKCRVHQDFRLIVVAEKEVVYDKFPIPLINRLEKHFLTLDNMMTPEQIEMAKQLKMWAEEFVTHTSHLLDKGNVSKEIPEDAFIGYHADTAAAIVLQVWGRRDKSDVAKISLFDECKETLLWCASPQYVVRLPDSKLYSEADHVKAIYWKHQKHDDIIQYLQWKMVEEQQHKLQAQITTHSKLLTDQEKDDLARKLNLTQNNIILLTLQSFDTEQQFAQQIKNFIQQCKEGQKLLLIQCGSGDRNQSLIKSAQYCVLDELPDGDLFAVVFIIQLPNIAGGCFSGFQAGKWHSLHLDELRPQPKQNPTMEQLHHNSPAKILKRMIKHQPTKDVEPLKSSDMESSFATIEEGPEVIYQRTADVETTECEPVAPFLQKLLLLCIQSAAALVKDEESTLRRSTERIEMLLTLIGYQQDEDARVFVQGLCGLIISLLEEQEQSLSGGYLATNWLFKEAAQTENVQQTGTFRRAWGQELEKKVTPKLAAVIAFLDTNRNMDFFCTSDKPPWTKKLWLGMLQNTSLCFDHCKSLVPVQEKNPHGEIITRYLCVGGSVDIQTPFFWLLYQVIDQAVTECRETGEGEGGGVEDFLKYLESIIRATPCGEVILSNVEDEDQSQVITAYLGDFVQTVHPGMSMEIRKILCDSLLNAARQNKRERDLESLGLIDALVYIHIVHSEAKERLQLFLEVEQIWPEVVHAITSLKSNVGGNPLLTDTEMTVDILSAVLLLEHLDPNKQLNTEKSQNMEELARDEGRKKEQLSTKKGRKTEQLKTDEGRAVWMDRVKTCLPIIERILNTTETDLKHGPVCCRFLDQIRCGWVRIVTVKLYLESCVSNEKYQMETWCMSLWLILGESADLTKMKSLKSVEMFLKSVNAGVEKAISGKLAKCNHCDTEFGEKLAAELPCDHRICLRCFADLQVRDAGDRTCPTCQANIPEDFQPGSSSHQTEVLKEYRHYQKCSNNFLMLVVSKLCFGGSGTPESAVIERIFSYITRRVEVGQHGRKLCTKEMSLYNDIIDPTPVVRSFLLQLLIHKSEEAVTSYLQDFFLQARDLCQQGREETSQTTLEEIVQFSLLVIHCFEDLYHERSSARGDPVAKMEDASHYLAEGRTLIVKSGIDMPKMLAIAKCRFGLSVATKYLHAVFVQKSVSESREFHNLLYEVKNLLDVAQTEWPKKFLVKQICKELGTDSYQTISSPDTAPWLAVETTQEVKECPDRYVVCLNNYKHLREAVAKILLGENVQSLKQIPQDDEMLLMLAVHREVTMKNVKPQSEADALQLKPQQTLQNFFNNAPDETVQRDLGQQLLRNEFGRVGSHLNIYPEQNLREQSLACLLFHTSLVLTHYNNKPGFFKPLSDLITNPGDMGDKLLPTMPQDDTESVRQTMLRALQAHKEMAGQVVVFFTCPSNHPYAITECGRPYTEGKCNICGQKIGGERHKAFAGNVPHSGKDETRQGYILGTAAERTNTFAGERQLGGAACAILRFFTHAALMLGTETDAPAVAGLVYPPLQEDVGEFFWNHLQKDLEIIHLATGKSVDDVFLLLHFICHQMNHLEMYRNSGDLVLTTKQARETWEDQFATTFINTPLKDLDNCLTMCNDLILNDHRIGQDKLMSILYEVDKTTPTEVECLHEFPSVWRYRSRITLEHFLREFSLCVENNQNRQSKMAVLSLFRREHPYLQALHHIPNILRLQQYLMAKNRRRLDRVQATTVTIAEMLSQQDIKMRGEVQKLLPDLTAAWERVKEHLHSKACLTYDGLIHLPDAYKNMVIDENSPLAVLLPSTQGPGICSYMMLEFLFRKHNEFMAEYCQKTKSRYERLPEVSVRKLHSNHLINYHPERDLLPIVLANCNYSFELGKGTTIEYDFEGFEYQLQEVVLQSKSRVEQKSGIIPIDTMIYKADAGNAVMFTTLRDKIPQESLTPAVRLQICTELKSNLPDICDSINNLNIAISFLKSLGGNGDRPLHKFMSDSLKMKQTITSQKARQFCQEKHAQSLWLLLNFEKAVVLGHQFKQDPFPHVENDQREELSPEMTAGLEEFCQNKSVDKLEYLLQQIFDCLLLRVTQPVNPYDEDAVDMRTRSLGHILMGHLEAPLYNSVEENTEHTEQILTVDELSAFPADILGKHIPDTWLMILKEAKQRRKETLV